MEPLLSVAHAFDEYIGAPPARDMLPTPLHSGVPRLAESINRFSRLHLEGQIQALPRARAHSLARTSQVMDSAHQTEAIMDVPESFGCPQSGSVGLLQRASVTCDRFPAFHQAIYPARPGECRLAPAAGGAPERRPAPQTHAHICSRRLWQDHAGQRMARHARTTGGLPVAG